MFRSSLRVAEQVWLRKPVPGGMYCASVSGRYVPLGAQKYALVATGRGLQACDAAGVQFKVSNTASVLAGVYTNIFSTCSATVGNPQFEPTFSPAGNKFVLTQSGGCVSLRDGSSGPGSKSDQAATVASSPSLFASRWSTDATTWGNYPYTGLSNGDFASSFHASGWLTSAAADAFNLTDSKQRTFLGTDPFSIRFS